MGKFEIGRILHFKPEIRNLRLDGISMSNLRFPEAGGEYQQQVEEFHKLAAVVAKRRRRREDKARDPGREDNRRKANSPPFFGKGGEFASLQPLQYRGCLVHHAAAPAA